MIATVRARCKADVPPVELLAMSDSFIDGMTNTREEVLFSSILFPHDR